MSPLIKIYEADPLHCVFKVLATRFDTGLVDELGTVILNYIAMGGGYTTRYVFHPPNTLAHQWFTVTTFEDARLLIGGRYYDNLNPRIYVVDVTRADFLKVFDDECASYFGTSEEVRDVFC